MISRRSFFLGLGFAAVAGPATPQAAGESLADIVRRVEEKIGCRLGVAVSAPFGQASVRGEERFPLCSTFKLLAAAAILNRVDQGRERLDRRVVFEAASLVARIAGDEQARRRAGHGDGRNLRGGDHAQR